LQVRGNYETAATADEQAAQFGHRCGHLALLDPHLLPDAALF